MNKKITYFGILRSITSWAKISREMISSLLSIGADVNIYERKGFLFDNKFPLNYSIKTKITNQFKGDVVFTFEHPRTYDYLPPHCFKIGFLVYEFTVLPQGWVERINRYLDWVIVPSQFCKRVFKNCGVAQHKIKVLRYGFNPDYYFPRDKKLPRNTDFTFLCIANPHKREGIELLLRSFTQAFTKQDKVKLVLKLTYRPTKTIKIFEYKNFNGLLNSYLEKRNAPLIQVIDTQLTERQMGSLYRNSHCYFSLSRAEAFGLCFLEALACGLPVVSVRWGGSTDFLNKQNARFIKHTLVPANQEVYEKINKAETETALIALPDVNQAAETMYNMYYKRQDSVMQKCSLHPNPHYFWWSTIAKEFLDLLSKIL